MTDERADDVAGATSRDFAGGQKIFGRYTLVKVLRFEPAARRRGRRGARDLRKSGAGYSSRLEKVAPGTFQEAWLHADLGRAYAGLGEAASAIAEGQKAMAMRPTSKDPFEGPSGEESMARIYALLGDADHAVLILQRLLQIPYGFAITPALLRLDPIWDQIRNDPRFQELAAEKKP